MKFILFIFALGSIIGSLYLITLSGSVYADFQSGSDAGPGVDIHVFTKYPVKGEPIKIEVSARGGKSAGLYTAVATPRFETSKTLVEVHGDGMDWGKSLSGKVRGSEEVEMSVPTEEITEGNQIRFAVYVDYVCAMSSSGRRFKNIDKTAVVYVNLQLYDEDDKFSAQLLGFAAPLFYGYCQLNDRWANWTS